MENKELSITQNMLYNTVGSMVLLVCQWLVSIFVVRLSNYEDAGLLALAMSVTNIFFGIGIFGVRTFQVSDINGTYTASTYVTSRLITCLLSQVLCMIFVICNVQYTYKQMACVIIYMVFRVMEAFVDVLHGIEQQKMRMDYIGVSSIIRGILILLVFILGMKLTGSLNVSILLMTGVSAFIIVFYDIPHSQRLSNYGIRVCKEEIYGVLKECFPLMVNTVVLTSMISVPRYFLELFEGEEILGIYGSIATPTVIMQTASSWIYNPLIPKFAISYTKKMKTEYLNLLKKTFIFMCIAFLGIIIGVILFGNWGLKILFGSDILKYSDLLIEIVFVTMLISIVNFFNMILTICRRQKSVAIINGMTLIGIGLLSFLMIPRYHMHGVNYALYIALFIDCLISIIVIARCIKQNFRGIE